MAYLFLMLCTTVIGSILLAAQNNSVQHQQKVLQNDFRRTQAEVINCYWLMFSRRNFLVVKDFYQVNLINLHSERFIRNSNQGISG